MFIWISNKITRNIESIYLWNMHDKLSLLIDNGNNLPHYVNFIALTFQHHWHSISVNCLTIMCGSCLKLRINQLEAIESKLTCFFFLQLKKAIVIRICEPIWRILIPINSPWKYLIVKFSFLQPDKCDSYAKIWWVWE